MTTHKELIEYTDRLADTVVSGKYNEFLEWCYDSGLDSLVAASRNYSPSRDSHGLSTFIRVSLDTAYENIDPKSINPLLNLLKNTEGLTLSEAQNIVNIIETA